MYLLNARQIERYVQSPRGQYLDIDNFDKEKLQHTAYYFRLGDRYQRPSPQSTQFLTTEKPELVLEPNSYAIIRTEESFWLSEKVLGIIGQASKLMMGGLQLVHSPFIDPLFEGRLELGLSNLASKSVSIKLGQIIGKVSFFDISDTYPIEMIRGSILEKTFARRSPSRDDDPVEFVEESDRITRQ